MVKRGVEWGAMGYRCWQERAAVAYEDYDGGGGGGSGAGSLLNIMGSSFGLCIYLFILGHL